MLSSKWHSGKSTESSSYAGGWYKENFSELYYCYSINHSMKINLVITSPVMKHKNSIKGYSLYVAD